MRSTHGVAAITLVLSACTAPPDERFGFRKRDGGGVVIQAGMTSVDSMRVELERLRRDGAERDSALALVRATQELIEGVDRELAAIPGMDERQLSLENGGGEGAPEGDIARAVMLKIARVKELAEQSDAAIHTLKQQLASMTSARDGLRDENRELRTSMEHFVALAEGLQKDLTRANERIAQLEAENLQLAQKVIVISDTVTALRTRERTVYIAMGSERELLEAGVLRKKGGIRLGPWTPGQTLVPSDDAPTGAFRAIDMLHDRDIGLTSDGAAYRIASSHNVALLTGSDGSVVRNRMEVRDPERFWRQSRFLILVRQD